MMKNKILFVALFSLVGTILFGQKGYSFRREIKGIKDLWHSIPFPNDLYASFEKYPDFRILGITPKGDTVEAPYYFNTNTETVNSVKIGFNLLNQTHNSAGYFYTFETVKKTAINEIVLNFRDENFDWKVALEGSENDKDWFTILDNQRILGIKNEAVDYHYTTLHFPFAKYRYWRVCVKSAIKPDFIDAELHFQAVSEEKLITHAIKNTDIEQDKVKKRTLITLDLGEYLPVSYLKIAIKDTVDYIRNVHFYHLVDNDKPYFLPFNAGTLSSLEKNEYHFNAVFLKKCQITIDNYDNAPLTIGDITIKGNPFEFVARFTEPAQYYLYYGGKKRSMPHYDIENFKNNVPVIKTLLTLGNEEQLMPFDKVSEPFFKNKWWLWGIMLTIILVLGWQTFKMMQKK